MKNIKSEAKAFRGQIKGDITLEALEGYVKKIGYQTCYYNDNGAGDRKLETLGCLEKAANRQSFCLTSKYENLICIDSRESEHAKIILFLHEIGHINLHHSDTKKDNQKMELEANAFTYEVLSRPSKPRTFKLLIISLFAFLFIIATVATTAIIITIDTKHTTNLHNIDTVSPSQECTYYVTKFGKKYHKIGCKYLKSRDFEELKEEEIYKYEPCSVCIGN